MAAPAQFSPSDHAAPRETFLHYVAREGRVVMRWFMAASIVATVIIMVSPFWMAAVIPALMLLAAYVLLVVADAVERRSDPQAHAALERAETAVVSDVVEDHAEDDQLAPDEAYLVKRESATGVAIIAAIMIAALAIAAILLPLSLVAIGALVVFAYMLLIAAPLWLGWFNDDVEIEAHRIHGQPEPPSVKTS